MPGLVLDFVSPTSPIMRPMSPGRLVDMDDDREQNRNNSCRTRRLSRPDRMSLAGGAELASSCGVARGAPVGRRLHSLWLLLEHALRALAGGAGASPQPRI